MVSGLIVAIGGKAELRVCGRAPQVGAWTKRLPPVFEVDEEDENDVCLKPCGLHGAPPAPPPLLAPAGVEEEPLGDPLELREDADRADEAMARLACSSRTERRRIVAWLSEASQALALSKHGCRVVQKALDVAEGPCRAALAARLQPCVDELYRSPHGNHVLSKMVEVLPAASMGFAIAEFSGQAVTVAQHRFGSRVLERLIEHCSEAQIHGLAEEISGQADSLSQHPYGNFVVQHLLEYGSPECQACILQRLLPSLPQLATHRIASRVVQRLLDCCGEQGRDAVGGALLRAERPYSIVDVAGNRFGALVAEELAGVQGRGDEARARLSQGLAELCKSKSGRRVLGRFGLLPAKDPSSLPDDRVGRTAEAAAAA
mmetsp:Transcript_94634/g.294673  ORF Transcript_94634/g.294673 Transcript_94634/m.294673 type:complete len:374 (-) Transcript_94634:54-1175(-)